MNICFILARGMILYLFSEKSTPVVRPLQQPPHPTPQNHWVKQPVLEADHSGGPVKKSQSSVFKGGYTLVTLPRIATPYRDGVDGTRDRVTYQKLVTR
jgi:hypothetical protein